MNLRIDLHLPRGWNDATTEELEILAAAILHRQEQANRFRPFDWTQVKCDVFMAVNRLHVISADGEDDDESVRTFMVQRDEDKAPWPLTTEQVLSMIDDHLQWITDDKAQPLFGFPYAALKGGARNEDAGNSGESGSAALKGGAHNEGTLTLQGPPPLLDGYSWQTFRWLTDWMQAYMEAENALVKARNTTQRMTYRAAATDARCHFLALLFKSADGTEVSPQMFRGFSMVKWQVVLFWWSALMKQLQKKFPKVYKSQKVERGRKSRQPQRDTPWDFYNRTTATIQKYIGGLSEQDVNNASYGTILQQLQMMAEEAEEMEKIKQKR